MNDRCIQGLESLPQSVHGCVLSIGNFDGVHLGHQRIIRRVRRLADEKGASGVVMTFEPPPEFVLRPEALPRRVTPADEKARLLLEFGADFVIFAPTDKEFLGATGREFIENTVVKRIAPKHIVEGRNFFFGLGRSGNIETLIQGAETGGYQVHIVEPVSLEVPNGSHRVSSTLIRSLIEQGDIISAARCLNRDYALFGEVISGAGVGAKLLGFPTINLNTGQQAVPPDGVYAGRATVTQRDYPAAISIGKNPTMGGKTRAIEAHLLDPEGDFLGNRVALRFIERIRDQKKFQDTEALKQQIAKDVQRVRETIE